MDKRLSITPIPALKDNYIWCLINTEQGTAIVIDPGEAKPVIDFLHKHQVQLIAIFITHHHWDHTNGIAELIQPTTFVYGPHTETIPHLTNAVQEKDDITLAGFPTFKVMNIPGHTLGHIAYYSPGMLFCGDTLFASGCGRLFEGTAAQLFDSLQKIAALPEDTAIYCAHEYTLRNLQFAAMVEPNNEKIKERLNVVNELRKKLLPTLPSSLREEKASNPFLRCHSMELRAQVEAYAHQTLTHEVDIFACLRKWKDSF